MHEPWHTALLDVSVYAQRPTNDVSRGALGGSFSDLFCVVAIFRPHLGTISSKPPPQPVSTSLGEGSIGEGSIGKARSGPVPETTGRDRPRFVHRERTESGIF